MGLNNDANELLTRIQRLVGKAKTEAFVAAIGNSATGDRLPAVLQFLDADGTRDDVLITAVTTLADPAFDAATATLEEIQGIAYIVKRAVEAELLELPLDPVALREMRTRAAEEFARREKRMQKPQLLSHLAAKCGISETTAELVLNELAELAIQETNAYDAFGIPGIGTIVKLFREERLGRNPQTGAPIPIPAKTIIKFRLESKLKRMCGDSSTDPAS